MERGHQKQRVALSVHPFNKVKQKAIAQVGREK
jgi:hypothetical protein